MSDVGGRPRFGLVGTGAWARVHAAALGYHPAVDFVAVYGRDPASRHELASQWGVDDVADYQAFLARCDGVAFAVDPRIQPQLASEAASTGRLLVLEKPVAIDAGAARGLADRIDEFGARASVFLTRLWEPESRGWLEENRRGAGDIESMRIRIRTDAFSSPAYGASLWRREYGPLWDLGPHAISIATYVLGELDSIEYRASGEDVLLRTRHWRVTCDIELSMSGAPGSSIEDWTVRRRQRPDLVWHRTDPDPVEAYGAMLDALLGIGEPMPVLVDAAFGARISSALDAVADLRQASL